MTSLYIVYLTGAGAAQQLADVKLPANYQPIKGNMIRSSKEIYVVTGYVKLIQPQQSTTLSITVRRV